MAVDYIQGILVQGVFGKIKDTAELTMTQNLWGLDNYVCGPPDTSCDPESQTLS